MCRARAQRRERKFSRSFRSAFPARRVFPEHSRPLPKGRQPFYLPLASCRLTLLKYVNAYVCVFRCFLYDSRWRPCGDSSRNLSGKNSRSEKRSWNYMFRLSPRLKSSATGLSSSREKLLITDLCQLWLIIWFSIVILIAMIFFACLFRKFEEITKIPEYLFVNFFRLRW